MSKIIMNINAVKNVRNNKSFVWVLLPELRKTERGMQNNSECMMPLSVQRSHIRK